MADDLGQIEGWKAIADYLNRSVRTVQNWTRTRGLPVIKVGGVVVAYKSELDRWQMEAACPPGSSGASSPQPVPDASVAGVAPRSRAYLIAPAVALIFMTLAAVAFRRSQEPRKRNPVDYRIEGSALQTLDRWGQVAWEYALPDLPQPGVYTQDDRSRYATFAYLHGDESPSFLFAYYPRGGNRSILYCFGPDGKVLWTATLGRLLRARSGTTIFPNYWTNQIRILKKPLSNGGRIVVGSHHSYSWAYQIAILTDQGKQVAEYWHPGWLFSIGLADLGVNGSEDIVAGGLVNGVVEEPEVVLLDPNDCSGEGISPGIDTLKIEGASRADEKAVLVFSGFPKIDPGAQWRIDDIKATPDLVELRLTDGNRVHVFCDLDLHFHVLGITPDTTLMEKNWARLHGNRSAAEIKAGLGEVQTIKALQERN